MATQNSTSRTIKTTSKRSNQEQAEWLENQLKAIKESYNTYIEHLNKNCQGKTLSKLKNKGRYSFDGLSINWEIIDKKLYIALIFKTNDLKMYEILETARDNGCFKQTFNKDLPQLVQTLDNHVALCYSTNGEIIPYWDKDKLRNQFIQQYTQTAKGKVYSVVKKKEFEKQINKLLPKTFDTNELKGKNYLYIPLLVKNNSKTPTIDNSNQLFK